MGRKSHSPRSGGKGDLAGRSIGAESLLMRPAALFLTLPFLLSSLFWSEARAEPAGKGALDGEIHRVEAELLLDVDGSGPARPSAPASASGCTRAGTSTGGIPESQASRVRSSSKALPSSPSSGPSPRPSARVAASSGPMATTERSSSSRKGGRRRRRARTRSSPVRTSSSARWIAFRRSSRSASRSAWAKRGALHRRRPSSMRPRHASPATRRESAPR